jgi:hypothetical protein
MDPRVRRLLGIVSIAATLGGCGSTPSGSLPLATSGPLGGLPTVDRSFPPDRVIDVELAAPTRLLSHGEPLARLELKAGQEYLFRVTNTSNGTVDHNFYVGAPADLIDRRYDRLTGIPVFSSGTAEFTYTVPQPGARLQFACTLFEHYGAMHGDLVIEP